MDPSQRVQRGDFNQSGYKRPVKRGKKWNGRNIDNKNLQLLSSGPIQNEITTADLVKVGFLLFLLGSAAGAAARPTRINSHTYVKTINSTTSSSTNNTSNNATVIHGLSLQNLSSNSASPLPSQSSKPPGNFKNNSDSSPSCARDFVVLKETAIAKNHNATNEEVSQFVCDPPPKWIQPEEEWAELRSKFVDEHASLILDALALNKPQVDQQLFLDNIHYLLLFLSSELNRDVSLIPCNPTSSSLPESIAEVVVRTARTWLDVTTKTPEAKGQAHARAMTYLNSLNAYLEIMTPRDLAISRVVSYERGPYFVDWTYAPGDTPPAASITCYEEEISNLTKALKADDIYYEESEIIGFLCEDELREDEVWNKRHFLREFLPIVTKSFRVRRYNVESKRNELFFTHISMLWIFMCEERLLEQRFPMWACWKTTKNAITQTCKYSFAWEIDTLSLHPIDDTNERTFDGFLINGFFRWQDGVKHYCDDLNGYTSLLSDKEMIAMRYRHYRQSYYNYWLQHGATSSLKALSGFKFLISLWKSLDL